LCREGQSLAIALEKSWVFFINYAKILQRNPSVNLICENTAVQAAATKFLREGCTIIQRAAQKRTLQT